MHALDPRIRDNARILMSFTAAVIGAAMGYFAGQHSVNAKHLASRTVLGSNVQAPLQREPQRIKAIHFVTLPGQRETTAEPVLSEEATKAKYKHRVDEDWVAKTAAERSPEYSEVFSRLGLSADQIDHFKSVLKDIHAKAITSGEGISELQRMRQTYDDELSSALGPEGYQRYREYERMKPAQREYENLASYASNKLNTTLDPSQAGLVIPLIGQAEAYTIETWDGPYDPSPHPAYGRRQMADQITRQIKDFEIKVGLTLEAAHASGLPDDLLTVIEGYYSNALLQKRETLAFVDRPREEIVRDLETQRDQEIAAERERQNRQGVAR